MKRLITVIVILSLIFFLSFLGTVYSHKTDLYYEGLVKEAESLCDDQKAEELLTLAEEMKTDWDKRETILSLYVRHEELDKMETNLVNLKAHAENRDFKNANAVLYQIDYLAEHIYERELLNINNLF